MWLFLSSRLRTWLLLAVGVPIARRVVRAIRQRAARKHPDARTVQALGEVDSALSRVDRREKRRRKRQQEAAESSS